eukprot:CAMPEP_0204638704 /NCGR_PEP_ID=MMETSP0717-20131115/40210_1 /ASSEMBLY_ACC=CAM_ASM_000666 /TAXON_ID=230516 /ORGANISM="Chaetoceros curvisetus" /LENGTH=94 /DNA_ID=CAMNT_0051658555 /DNA_START=360 /DNA_END=641 /DNA_ORIENTATION=+
MTGKLVKDDPNAMIRVIDYRTLYHSIPCVGVDCPTISSAIDQLKFQRPSVKRTIRDAYGDDSDNGNADNGNRNGNNDDDGELISICIRAAFPCR